MFFILYKTTNLINKKEYIGIHQTSNINDGYLGSGLAMKRAIIKYGKKNFKREILEYCFSIDDLIRREKELVNEEWINRENTYNLKTGGNSYGLLSDKSKNKISQTLKDKYSRGEIQYHGKPYVPNEEQKKQISNTLKQKFADGSRVNIGREPWNKGLSGLPTWNKGVKSGPMAEEQKISISKTQKDRFKNDPELSKRQSDNLREYYKTHSNPMQGKTPWNKGLVIPKTECPHCGKLVDEGNGKRWHFDNCKNIKNI
jgi:hypothetical protein